MSVITAGEGIVGDSAPVQRVLTFIECDGPDNSPTGRSASMVGVRVDPLGYVELIRHRLDDPVTIPFSFSSAKIIESSIPEMVVGQYATVTSKLSSSYTAKTIGLVKGGWLPSGLALQQNMVVLPDRCTIKEIRSRFHQGAKKARTSDFLDFFGDKEVAINPALFALESNIRRVPTPDVIAQQLEQAYAELRAALPKAKLVPENGSSLLGIIGVNNDTREGMLRKQRFLMRLARKIHAPVPARKVDALWDEIVAAADGCDVPRASLVVVAALSSILVPNGRSPAKKMLKLKESYTEKDAYNALADLRALEVLMCLFATNPDDEIMLCTGDRDLALFWTGLQASNFRWEESFASFDVSLIEELVPGKREAIADLWRGALESKPKLSQLATSITRK